MSFQKLPPPEWISTEENLVLMVEKITKQKQVAIDTESNSLHAFQEQVCLLQFSIPNCDYLLDPLAVKDLSILTDVFENEKIEKVFHAAEYDLLCLKRDFNFSIQKIFDTMQAARILGYSAVGLNNLLFEKYKIQLDKRFQKADWAKRPLPPDQLNYARMDTHYLIGLRNTFFEELKNNNLWELATEEFQRISSCNEFQEESSIPAWQRIPGANRLSPSEIPILIEVLDWRLNQAKRMNRPVFKIISNKLLLNIADFKPKRVEDLQKIGLTSRQIQMFGKEIITAVKKGLRSSPVYPTKPPRPDQAFLHRLEMLRNWRKQKGINLGFESDVILPRSFMHSIAEKNPQSINALAKLMPHSPWRLQQYGLEILDNLKE